MKIYSRKRFAKGLMAAVAALSTVGLVSGCAATNSGEVKSTSFSWTAYKGETLNLLLNQHPLSDTLKANISEFETKTGIKVKIETLPESDYMTKITTELQSKSGSYDMFMTASPMNFQYAAPGWMEDLQPWVDDATQTAPDWNFADFYPALISASRWDKTNFGGNGKGSLWSIPANEEGYALFYRKDILSANHIAVPSTIDELIAAAKKLNGSKFEGKTISGFVARGDKTFPTLNPFSTFAGAYGVHDIVNGKAAVNSPEGIQAVTKWAELMQSAPKAASTYTWYEAMQDFIAGNSAFFIDADHMAPGFEAKDSPIKGKVGYTLPPSGPKGRSSSLWVWSFGMNANSKHKGAAWQLIQWATSQETLTKAIALGNMNPTRLSVAASAEEAAATSTWGDYNATWQKILSDYAAWPYSPSATWTQVGDIWATAIQSVITGQSAVKDALDKAAAKIDVAIK